jgi:hypothetical protein
VTGPHIGGGGVDPQAEQPAWADAPLRSANVRMRGGAIAVLEDLDPDD